MLRSYTNSSTPQLRCLGLPRDVFCFAIEAVPGARRIGVGCLVSFNKFRALVKTQRGHNKPHPCRKQRFSDEKKGEKWLKRTISLEEDFLYARVALIQLFLGVTGRRICSEPACALLVCALNVAHIATQAI